jgi:hypothetical protein
MYKQKIDLPDVWKKMFSTDMKKTSIKHENPNLPPSSVIKCLALKRVVIDQNLHIQ